ncbi:MAG: ankyrin repeat domain-containing protein, partial [Gallionella sp.]|nr:ankyrin repeat domain-containing protein [Gallionella sp.]
MNQRLIRILGGSTEHYPYALESKYPRILEQIMSLWDSDEIDHCFMDLMVTNRGDRVGFPPEVAAEIMYLSLVHAAQESPDKNKDIWDASSNLFVNFTPHATLENSWPAPPADIQNELKKLGFYVTPEGFFDAIEENNRAAVALFIQVPISTEIRDNRGWTPLMLAAFLGNIEITELLIKSSADINALDLGGNSALHWAVFGCHTACTRILIEHHARTDTRNNFGWTPLMQA